VIKSEENASQLQYDLDQLSQWAQTWQMKFNHTKCTKIKCTRSHYESVISWNYVLQDHALETNTQSKYLGMILNNTLSRSPHISNIASRASKMLYKWNVHLLCGTHIRSHNNLEKIQHRVTRLVMPVSKYYSGFDGLSDKLHSLQWPTLELHQKIIRLSFFHKIMHNQSL